eukprot:517730-Pyramimonas_sp.AAC.1
MHIRAIQSATWREPRRAPCPSSVVVHRSASSSPPPPQCRRRRRRLCRRSSSSPAPLEGTSAVEARESPPPH